MFTSRFGCVAFILREKKLDYSCFKEKIHWTEPLRGHHHCTEKELEDNLAIGGLRDAANSVGRLHLVSQFGRMMGGKLVQLLANNKIAQDKTDMPDDNWINLTCNAIDLKTQQRGRQRTRWQQSGHS